MAKLDNNASKNIRSGLTMRPSLVKKTAGLVASLMIVSLLVPVLAFAGFSIIEDKTEFKNNSVTAVVYDEDGDNGGDGATQNLIIKDAKGNVIDTISISEANYEPVSGEYTFNIDVVSSSVYGGVYVEFEWALGVTDAVYLEHQSTSSTPPVIFYPTPSMNISASQIANAFANGELSATFTITGNSATLPASALADLPAGAIITIENSTGSYSLPVDAIDYEALAEELGVSIDNLSITITIERLIGSEATAYVNHAVAAGGNPVGSAVNFAVAAEGNGKSIAITDLGSTYAERTINVNAESSATGVLYNPETGEFSFIPATFEAGKAVLKSTTNSIYGVVEFDNSFADVNGHWGQSYVETIANKLIVEGYEDGSFGPDRSITRAEFATVIVRSLGLSSKTGTSSFSDVKADDWFANAVGLAAEAGIVNGYEDGTFKPNQTITREELAAMVVRASTYAGTDLTVNASTIASALASFNDANGIVWADAEIAAAVTAGIVEGFEDGSFRATNTATRAEASAMLQRFLLGADLISE